MKTDWRKRQRRQLPPITIRAHAADIRTAKLLELELLYRLGAITPDEYDQLEALRVLADAAAWVRKNTKKQLSNSHGYERNQRSTLNSA